MTTQAHVVKKADRLNIKVPEKAELLIKLHIVPSLKHRMLFTFLYLYGNRIEELVGMRNKGILKLQKWKLEPIKRHQVSVVEGSDGRQCLRVTNMVILKREVTPMGRLVRNIELPIQPEKELLEPLIAYIDTLKPDDALFDYHPAYVWDLAKKYFGNQYFPHFFRHTRATRLASDYGFNSLELATFFGWKDARMASTYAHLNLREITNKIR